MGIQGIFRCTHRCFLAGFIAFLSLAASHSVLALTISLNGINGFSQVSNPQAWNGFVVAAARYESVLADSVTVNLNVGFEPLGGSILGSTSIVNGGFSYSNVKTALTADSQSANDLTAVTNLPAGPNLSFLINDPTAVIPTTRIVDNNNSGNNGVLNIGKANAKALGLTGADATSDAEIKFSSSFSFDFDPSDGISSGFDFVGAATHEIGHALGFVSGVDVVDQTSGAGSSAPVNLDNFRVFSVWDMYRFTSESLLAGVDFDFATGGSAYFSIDGGATSLGTFSTGKINGDGRQASHWKDNLGLGIMDPTFASGELGVMTALDLVAFDVMGWDLAAAAVPVPATIWLFGSGLMGFAALGRRRRNNLRVSN